MKSFSSKHKLHQYLNFTLTWKAVANIVGLILRIVEICHFTDQGHINRVCVEQSLCNKFFGSSHLAVFWNLIWNVCWVRRRLVLTILQGTWGRNGDITIAFACDTKGSKGQRDCRKNHSQLSNFMIYKQLGPLWWLVWKYLHCSYLCQDLLNSPSSLVFGAGEPFSIKRHLREKDFQNLHLKRKKGWNLL